MNVHPAVDYYSTLGKIYYFSKINLAFTLPTIETGVPLRIFDIMAFGGFVISNYQAELSDLFEIGKEIVVYHDAEELFELTDYYLSHEKERLQIAVNGYKRVNRDHSIPARLKKMLEICAQG